MKSIILRSCFILGVFIIMTACSTPPAASTIPSTTLLAQPSADLVNVSTPAAETAEPTLAPTPTPEPTPEQVGILGAWTLMGSYDPEKWGFGVDETQPLPKEKIDPANETFIIILNEDGLADKNSGETYKVKYDEKGATATVDSEMYWVCILVDNIQLFEFYGDTLNIYQRIEHTE